MRLLTKVMTGVSVLALSALVAGGVDAQAATFKTDKTLSVTPGEMVSYDAVKAKGDALTWNANANWDMYYAAADVDLSNIKTAKDAYITVKNSAGTATVYKIKADTVKKYGGKIAANVLTLTEDKTEVKKADAHWASYQYRTEHGDWKTLTANTDLSLVPYEQQGASLYFRYKGAASITATPDASAKVDGAPANTSVSVIAENSFPSKEFKVKVPKMGNAPKINIDYSTGTVKVAKGAEFRQGASFSDATTGWADFKEPYTINVAQAGIFQMRTKATDKKGASKIAVYSWSTVTAPTVIANATANAGGDIITGELKYTSAEATDKKKATFEIENTTKADAGKTIVLYKAKMNGSVVAQPVVADGKAVATLAPGKKVTLKDAKVADGTVLVVQYAGDKKTDKLPSGLATAQVTVRYNVKAAE